MFPEKDLKQFCEKLKAGEVVAAPAEGVYGYCADPFNKNALEKLLAIKNRTAGKGFITLIRNLQDLEGLTQTLSGGHIKEVKKYWPGPVTFIIPAAEGVPELLTGGRGTVAVRLPRSDYMQEYLEAWGGPLVSTSANISGQMPATHYRDLSNEVFALKASSQLTGGISQVMDLITGQLLRP